jgi:peptide/nickel transport system permease protein
VRSVSLRGISGVFGQPSTAARRWMSFARRDPQMVIALAVICAWIVAVVGAGLLTPGSPVAENVDIRLQPPSFAHPFGTDELGRDVLRRVFYGGRTSLPAALVVVSVGLGVGTSLGAVAGYVGGVVDEVVMRVTDMVLAFPVLVLAMAVAAALGASLSHGVVALAAVWWPQYVRVCRGLVMDLREKDYVVASRAAGRLPLHTLAFVVMPNVLPSLLVMAAIDIGRAILNFATLSFLGLGAKPPQPEWGSMVSDGVDVMDQWWVATFPGLAILSLVFAFNLLGDSVRDALDPWIGGRR